MNLPITLAWLLDEASTAYSGDHFLAALGARLIADDVPLAGGALTLAAPHPMIARRTWLWRAETGAVIEALGFDALGSAGPAQGDVGRDWLTRLGGAVVQRCRRCRAGWSRARLVDLAAAHRAGIRAA